MEIEAIQGWLIAAVKQRLAVYKTFRKLMDRWIVHTTRRGGVLLPIDIRKSQTRSRNTRAQSGEENRPSSAITRQTSREIPPQKCNVP